MTREEKTIFIFNHLREYGRQLLDISEQEQDTFLRCLKSSLLSLEILELQNEILQERIELEELKKNIKLAREISA